MSVEFTTPATTAPLAAKAGRLRALAPWLALGLVLGAAVLQQALVPTNIDVAWLLTAGEKVLAGHPLYGDVLETNPPMAVGTYLPAILLGRLLGVAPEAITDLMVLAAALISVGTVAAMLRGSSLRGDGASWPALAFTLAVLLILPGQNFAEREHIALIPLLPALALAARRAAGERAARWSILAAAVGAAWTLSFKPHFVLAVATAPLVAGYCRRSWRPILAPEWWIAGALVVVYALLTLILLPDYVAVVLPMVRDVYLKLHRPVLQLVFSVQVLVAAAMLIGAWRLRQGQPRDPLFLVLTAAGCGFGVAFLIQQKGWAYQAYPMVALVLLAFFRAIVTRAPVPGQGRELSAPILLALGFFGTWLALSASFKVRDLEARVAQLGPHPRILALSGEPGVGHPLVRDLKGTWVSRQQALLVHDYVVRLRPQAGTPQATALLDTYAGRERANLIADFKATPPDVVLVDNLTDNWGEFVANDAEVRALLAPYRLVATVGGIDILKREILKRGE